MKKLLTVLLLCFALFVPVTLASSESGSIRQYLPPASSDFFNIKFTHGIWVDKNVNKVVVYAYGSGKKVVDTLQINVKPNDIIYLDFYCNNNYSITFWNGNKKLSQYGVKKSTSTKVCPKYSIEVSDYVPSENRYASDTFKNTKIELRKPTTNGGISTRRIN